jgi:hypothetical protein
VAAVDAAHDQRARASAEVQELEDLGDRDVV